MLLLRFLTLQIVLKLGKPEAGSYFDGFTVDDHGIRFPVLGELNVLITH
jgi:hypothetical protein